MYETEVQDLLRLETSGDKIIANLAARLLDLVDELRDAHLCIELAAAHREADQSKLKSVCAILDQVRSEPLSPSAALAEIARLVEGGAIESPA